MLRSRFVALLMVVTLAGCVSSKPPLMPLSQARHLEIAFVSDPVWQGRGQDRVRADIFLTDPEGRSRVGVVIGRFLGSLIAPVVWSPDGRCLAVEVSDRSGRAVEIFCEDGENWRIADAAYAAWSPDMSRLAYYRPQDHSINVLEVGTGMTRTLVARVIVEDYYGGYVRVTWSPSGSQLAYESQIRKDGHAVFAVHVVEADGSNPRQIAVGWGPAWSPTRAEIVFVNFFDRGRLWLTDADGRNARPIGEAYGASWPAWSPDGEQIVFSRSTGDNRDLWIVGRDGTNLRRLTDTPIDEISPAWRVRR